MSVNKNIKNGDFREVFVYPDQNDNNKPRLLKDLVNESVKAKDKIIASIFLRCVKSNVPIANDPKANTETFLVLKPKCLWLKASGETIVDDLNVERKNIAAFQDYINYEKIKISFLHRPYSVQEILTAQGVTGVTEIWNLQRVFTYDLNDFNRIRNAAISPVGNSNLNNIWL